MAATIHVIPSAPEGLGVVDLLEDTLARAREGEFSSLCVVYVDRDGCTGHGFSELHSTAAMLGALARTSHAILEG